MAKVSSPPFGRDTPPAYSRTGVTSPLGKLTEVIPAFKVSCETKELLQHEANEAGLSLQEFCREVLMVRAHGVERLLKLQADRLAVVAGKVGES